MFGGKGVTSIAVEEFVEGHEGFYDTMSVGGQAPLDFVSHYYPNVLDAMRTRWISPQFISTNRVDSVAEYAELRELGHRVAETLGIGTSATHMEWFFGPKGLKFSEIGCRPPGVGAWDLYSAGNDLDLYREWANAIVHGNVSASPVPPVRQRHHRAAARPRRPDRRLLGCRRGAGEVRRVGAGRPSAQSRDPHPAARGRLHGQRLRPDAAHRTTTCSGRCSTTWDGPSRSTPREPRGRPAGVTTPTECAARRPRPGPSRADRHGDRWLAGAGARRRRAERAAR